MSRWKWAPERSEGIWRHGAVRFRPFLSAVPWITVLLLVEMVHLLGGTLVSAKGVLFDLPAGSGLVDGESAALVALVMPTPHGTIVFFDDARYALGDEASVAALGEHLADRAAKTDRKTLLVLADRRIATGELMKMAGMARASGVGRVLFAEKNEGKADE